MELESIPIDDIVELKAVLDSSVFKSLLTVSVQAKKKQLTSIFVFQCEDVRVGTHTAAASETQTH